MREHARAVGVAGLACERGVLQWHEHADVPGGRVDRAGKRDDQQHGVVARAGERDAGRNHQAGRGQQEPAVAVTGGEQAGGDGHARRTEQRCGGEHPHLKRREAQGKQVGWQQDRHEAVAEIAQRACGEQLIHRPG